MPHQSHAKHPIRIPALRQDVTVKETGDARHPWAIVDPLLSQQVKIDAVGHIITEALATPMTAQEILGFAHLRGENRLDANLLFNHVRHLARTGLLEGARAQRLRHLADDEIESELSTPAHALPFDFVDGLDHACQACGSCCSATDVGPIPQNVVDDLLKVDWQEHIPGLESNADVFRRGDHGNRKIWLTAMRNDQCIFLAEDKLCRIHKVVGVQRKPTPCRQFPYVFSRVGDRIAVSLQLECRAYWKAKQAADPSSEHEGELRELLSLGAPLHSVPSRVLVDSGYVISREEYVALEAELVSATRGFHDTSLGPLAPLVGYARGVESALQRLYGTVAKEEAAFCGPELWRKAFPGAFVADPDPTLVFQGTLGRFADRIAQFSNEGADIATERKLPFLAERLRFLGRSVRALCGGVEPRSFRFTDPVAARAILEDVIVSSLFGKEAVRRGMLRAGLGLVAFRVLLTLFAAAMRAKEGCRVEIHTQDLIDSMVTVSKLLRERAVSDVLEELQSPVLTLFLVNLEVFVGGREPRAELAGGIR